MDWLSDLLARQWADFLARPSGPVGFRFLLQPIMAIIAAFKDGLEDARTGRSPYLWTGLTNAAKRRGRLREGLTATSRILVLGLIMDAAYQVIALRKFYPGEASSPSCSRSCPTLSPAGPLRASRRGVADPPATRVEHAATGERGAARRPGEAWGLAVRMEVIQGELFLSTGTCMVMGTALPTGRKGAIVDPRSRNREPAGRDTRE